MWRQFGATFFFAYPAHSDATVAVNNAITAFFFKMGQAVD